MNHFHYPTNALHYIKKLLAGSPKQDRSKVMAHTKTDTLILQVGGYAKGQLPFHAKQLQDKDCQRRNGTGRFSGYRRKRVQRNTNNNLYIGT